MRTTLHGWGRLVLVAMAVAALGLAGSVGAATNYVSLLGSNTEPYSDWGSAATNIQTAIDYAATHAGYDTVMVSNGTYVLASQISLTNAITVRSLPGQVTDTIVNGNGAYRGFYVSNANAVVDGFTVTNCSADYGGGVRIAAGVVQNCTITKSAAGGHSGGIYGEGGAVSNCVIEGCTMGGSSSGAGGVSIVAGAVRNCWIRGNRGGNYNWGHGGVYCSGGIVENCTIVSNWMNSTLGVSGAYVGGTGILRNCLVYGHKADTASVFCDGATLQNCTVSGNSASTANNTGGIQCSGNAVIDNTISYFNTSVTAGLENWRVASGTPAFSNCCTTPNVEAYGTNTVTGDPLFLNAAGGDYRMLGASPCVNSGTNRAWMTDATDLAGSNRVVGASVDRGAYEFDPGTLYACYTVSPSAGLAPLTVVLTSVIDGSDTNGAYYRWDFENNGSWDAEGFAAGVVTNPFTAAGYYTPLLSVSNANGIIATYSNLNAILAAPAIMYVATNGTHSSPFTNWVTAATNIQAAIDLGTHGTEVRVTQGVYRIGAQITVAKGITVVGVDGRANTIVDANGACRCFYVTHTNAVLDGLTIRNGSGTAGGGVFLDRGGTVKNCLITNNTSSGNSGGVCLYLGGLVTNCVIEKNSGGSGGGVMCSGGTVSHCTIADNTMSASHSGAGGVTLVAGAVRNCLIRGNLNGYFNWGEGGVYCSGGIVENCTIVSNRMTSNLGEASGAYVGGTGILRNCLVYGHSHYNATVICDGATVQNCTVSGNSASAANYTGGIQCSGNAVIDNTISYFNTSLTAGSENWRVASGTPAFTNCCTTPTPAAYGPGHQTNDPRFANAATNDYRLMGGSPCLDGGVRRSWMTGAADLAGNPRVLGGNPDIGAYEAPSRGTVFFLR